MTPDSWQQRTIAELCEMVKGSAPISKTNPGPFPLVTTGEERKTADYYQFDTAAVCVPMISSTGHGHASLKRVQYQEGKFALANLLTALLVRDESVISPRFLHLYLNYFKDKLIVPLMTGAANMSITVGRLGTVPVKFPSLVEQERILRTLNEADVLRRLRAQADRRITDLTPAIFNEMFGDPATNPQGWDKGTLSDFGAIVRYGLGQPPEITEFGLALLRATNIHRDSISEEGIIYVNPAAVPASRNAILKADDVLVVRSGAYTGDVARVGERWAGSVAGYDLIVSPNKKLTGRFVAWYLLSAFVQETYFNSLKLRAAQPHLNAAQVANTPFYCPPFPLQQQFAARVAEVRALEESQAASRERLDELFQSLLHRAFSGEL